MSRVHGLTRAAAVLLGASCVALAGCGGDTKIPDITGGRVAEGRAVEVRDVVLTTPKFLMGVSEKGFCVYGAFVSAPGLDVAAADTGLLVTSVGVEAPDAADSSTCPVVGSGAEGDLLPADLAPGEVADVLGAVAKYLSPTCASSETGARVGKWELAHVSTFSRSGTASVPRAALLAVGDAARLASPTDAAFHDAWGGVLVRLEGVVSAKGSSGKTDRFGAFRLAGGLRVSAKVYARVGGTGDHAPPMVTSGTPFDVVEGVSYLDGCTWSVAPVVKCSDLAPPVPGCPGAAPP